MKKLIIAFLFILQSSFAVAGSNPAGLEFGSSLSDVKAKYNLTYEKEEDITGGDVYSIKGERLDLYDVLSADVLFNRDKKLVGIRLYFNDFEFSELYEILSNKYEVIHEDFGVFQVSQADFKNKDVFIVLTSVPIFGFVSLYYLTEDYMVLLDDGKYNPKQEKEKKSRFIDSL